MDVQRQMPDVQRQTQEVQRQSQRPPRPEPTRTELPRPEPNRTELPRPEAASANYAPLSATTNSLLASIVETNGRVVNDLVTDNQLDFAVSQVNEVLRQSGRHLEHRVHEDTNTVMIRVVNTYTGEIIRELPDEERLDALFTIKEALGLNVNASI